MITTTVAIGLLQHTVTLLNPLKNLYVHYHHRRNPKCYNFFVITSGVLSFVTEVRELGLYSAYTSSLFICRCDTARISIRPPRRQLLLQKQHTTPRTVTAHVRRSPHSKIPENPHLRKYYNKETGT